MVHRNGGLVKPKMGASLRGRVSVARCGGPTEPEVYRQEVVGGIHDHWINPREGKWTYTYHQRLFSYRPLVNLMRPDEGPQFSPLNQVEYMIEKLASVPYSRRAQAITRIPHCDPGTDDPPCLQHLWARLLPGGCIVPLPSGFHPEPPGTHPLLAFPARQHYPYPRAYPSLALW